MCTYNLYDIHLDGDIVEPIKYRDALQTIRNANEGDVIRIYICSNGGSLTTSMLFRDAIIDSQAEVHAILVGEAHSGASMVALSCHMIRVMPSATMLVHCASFGSTGTSSNIRSHVNFVHDWTGKIIESVYNGFLTEDEIELVKSGVEYWFDSDEIQRRLEIMFSSNEEAVEELDKESSEPTSSGDFDTKHLHK